LKTLVTVLVLFFGLATGFEAAAQVKASWRPVRECAHRTLVTEQAELDYGRGEPIRIYRVIVREPAALAYFQQSGIANDGVPFGRNVTADETGAKILILGEKTTSPVFVEFDELTRKTDRPFSATVRSEGEGLKVMFHRYDKIGHQTQAVELANWYFGDCDDL
jgi:hypothetical protein